MARGDQEEFSNWVRERERSLIRAARAVCFDVQNAEDVLQEALADIYPRWSKLKDHENLEAYVIRVMVSKHADIRRKYARKKRRMKFHLSLWQPYCKQVITLKMSLRDCSCKLR